MGRKLGQHFLNSIEVAKFIVDSAELTGKETILEIGPGKGIITELLAKKAKKVITVEKDTALKPYLANLPENVEIIWGDIFDTEFPKVDRIVSNLPFYISSKLIFSLPPIKTVLGLQKEFAEKMVAKPGTSNYGRLSVSSQIKFHVEFLKSFPPSVFNPPPRVWLSIVKLSPNKWEEWKRAEDFIRRVFPYPNKKADNALKLAGYEPQGIEKRTRELTPDEVIELSKRLCP
ncbi:MAG: ribosomal RNA small subunit methyltransferase A [Candidatus Altiarchaeota archaeon]|nr:ribosomal RNA small subunit methyltransferase A [Candidatus Altiarchaeota archaeon]